MTIDPANFAPQGKPTKEQVRTVWESMSCASSRKVANLLTQRGFEISWRSVARWHAAGWQEEAGKTPISEKLHNIVRGEKKQSAGSAPAPEVLEQAMTGGGLKDDDYARIEKRIMALGAEGKQTLLEIQEKARLVMNIVLMEEATRRAHVMALIPKDTRAFVESFTDASKALAPMAPIEPVEPHRNGDNAKLIEGTATELSPLSQAIRRVREQVSA